MRGSSPLGHIGRVAGELRCILGGSADVRPVRRARPGDAAPSWTGAFAEWTLAMRTRASECGLRPWRSMPEWA